MQLSHAFKKTTRKLKHEYIRIIALIAIFAFSLLPLVYLVFNIAKADLSFVLKDKNFYTSITNSLIYSCISALITVVLALFVAYLLNNSNIRHKKIFVFVLTLGMLVPTLSIGLGIRELFGTNGILDMMLGIEIEASGWLGLIIGSVLISFPSTFLIIYDTLRYEDKTPYDAASIMGIKKTSTFFKLTLPYLKTCLISAFFAAFALIFSDYGIPMETAGKLKTIPMYLYEQVLSTYKYGRGAIAALVLLTPAIISFFFYIFTKDDKGSEKSKSMIKQSKTFNIVAIVTLIITAIILFIPQLTFISMAFMKSYPTDLGFTFDHFKSIFTGGYGSGAGIGRYISNSLIMSIFTAVIGSCFAYLLGYMTTRKKGKLGKVLHILAISSIAIPGLVLGIGYIFLFKETKGFFYGTMAILVVVNIFHFLGSPYLMAKNCLDKINKDYEVTGDSLGLSRWNIVSKVLIPQSKTTLLEMFSYFFINSMITISAVSFLFGFFTQPLSIMISTYEKYGDYEMQAVISVIILAINIIAKMLFAGIRKLTDKKFTRRKNKNGTN